MLFNHVQSNSEHIYIYINDFPRLLAIKKTGHFLHSASAPATAAPEHRAFLRTGTAPGDAGGPDNGPTCRPGTALCRNGNRTEPDEVDRAQATLSGQFLGRQCLRYFFGGFVGIQQVRMKRSCVKTAAASASPNLFLCLFVEDWRWYVDEQRQTFGHLTYTL